MALIILRGIHRNVLCLVIFTRLRGDQTDVQSTDTTSGKAPKGYDDKPTQDGQLIFGGLNCSHSTSIYTYVQLTLVCSILEALMVVSIKRQSRSFYTEAILRIQRS